MVLGLFSVQILEGDLSVDLEETLRNRSTLERAVGAGRRSFGTGDETESAAADVARRRSKVYVIEDVVGISADLQGEALCLDQLLEEADVGVHIVRAVDRVAPQISEICLG